MTGEAKAILKAASKGTGFDSGCFTPLGTHGARFTNLFQFAYMLTLLKTKSHTHAKYLLHPVVFGVE